ncbi:VP2 [Ashy storm petrel gyrovirus]|uniref:Dual specificity protein phosphatase VP2 n=1 Tax=Ashy storm petrel gyrovirus TaxID=2249930 RepID=A0A2Z4N3Y4_9VIRU|nr:VP2 [Ashy storm petrel gyrovirus]AWX63609.1 VP2 [Ashy storm petrel gyrovirus]
MSFSVLCRDTLRGTLQYNPKYQRDLANWFRDCSRTHRAICRCPSYRNHFKAPKPQTQEASTQTERPPKSVTILPARRGILSSPKDRSPGKRNKILHFDPFLNEALYHSKRRRKQLLQERPDNWHPLWEITPPLKACLDFDDTEEDTDTSDDDGGAGETDDEDDTVPHVDFDIGINGIVDGIPPEPSDASSSNRTLEQNPYGLPNHTTHSELLSKVLFSSHKQ